MLYTPVLEICEYIQKKLPELNVVAVVSGPVNVGRVVAVDQHLALFIFAKNDARLFPAFGNV